MPERRADVESLDWTSLQAHGAPEDIPAALHAIWSVDESRRRLGYDDLVRLLGHGASASPAAVAAVPFLVDVVADPQAPDRFAACQVLLQIAIGEEEITLNARPDFAHLRREAERKASLTVAQLDAEQAAWIAEAADPAERSAREAAALFADVEEDRDTERVNAEAYGAVRAGVPVYLTAVSADDPGTVVYAVQLLAYFPEDASSIVPALLPLIGRPDPIVAATAAMAAGICARGTGDPAAVAAITARRERAVERVERWATAIGLAQLGHLDPAIEADVRAATEATEPVAHLPFLDGDIAAVAGYTLDWLADQHRLPAGPWSVGAQG